jgi:hypothetical protein
VAATYNRLLLCGVASGSLDFEFHWFRVALNLRTRTRAEYVSGLS